MSSEQPVGTSWRSRLFPETERSMPGERHIRVGIRTVHIVAMAILVGGHFFQTPADRLHTPLMLAVLSGAVFVLFELYGTFNWLFEVRGLVTLAKIVLLLAIPFLWQQRIWILLAVVVMASISSHMPARMRYYSLLTRSQGIRKKG